jgi:putative ABC transport system substrate-binding protein
VQEHSATKTPEDVMKKTFIGLALSAILLALSIPAGAQQPAKLPRIGFVSSGIRDPKTPVPQVDEFRQGLRDLGYIEGKNILVEYRYVEGKVDRIPGIVAELVQLKVEIIVSPIPPAIRAAKQATKTIPIVMVVPTDPVATGLVDSLAHPGGNVTGLTRLTRELSGKRLELLKEAIPRISRVGVIWDDANAPGLATAFKEHEAAARALKLELQSLQVRGPNPDFERVFRDATKGRVSALIATMTLMVAPYPKEIAQLAIKNRLPLMFERSEFVDAGGLMSYSADDAESFRRAALYVDKILKGRKPDDLPVEQPMRFEFVVNLKTAKLIGVTIEPNVLVRAQRVIR